jgi:hypothetical protein
VRHVLRGVLLEPGRARYSFSVRPYIRTLYGDEGRLGFRKPIHEGLWQVWQPHFQALLMDVLAEDIFAPVGRITTLADVATAVLSGPDKFFEDGVTALALAGDRGRAEDYIREIEQKDPEYRKDWADSKRKFLAGDMAALCAKLRAREVRMVKALKVEQIWEPSPFAVELPAAERAARSAEPLFLPTPWIERPPWLLQEAPDRPGDVRFAKDQLSRNGGIVLLVPLTREQAEARHRDNEGYVLAQRLESGVLVRLRHGAGSNRLFGWYDGLSLPPRRSVRILLELEGSNASAQLLFRADRDDDRLLDLSLVMVRHRSERRRDWFSSVFEDGEVEIHDPRDPRDEPPATRPLTDAERALVTGPIPEFGEVDGLVTRALGWLRTAGYGEIT